MGVGVKQKRGAKLLFKIPDLDFLSGWQDSNLRPSAPKADALTGLRYTPKWSKK